MINKKVKKNKGFVLLFAVVLTVIFLSLALGVANIALKEIKFGTSAKDTNDAFFAADNGIECAFYNDKSPTYFGLAGAGTWRGCTSVAFPIPPSFTSKTAFYTFAVTGLGPSGLGCAYVTVTKDNNLAPNLKTTIISKGYNIGDASCSPATNLNHIEREIRVDY